MSDLDVYRERAQAHQRTLDLKLRYFTPASLAARWGVCETTVRNIPFNELPYQEFGTRRKKRRRYHPDDVAAFELRGRGIVPPAELAPMAGAA